jgi:UDP-2-acetamido-2-deoxy-ribo-hexuluronate aminotransferase
MTNNDELAKKMLMIANHGQSVKYVHDSIGCNSRLDTLQAAILDIKLKSLDKYRDARNAVADSYDAAFAELKGLTTPKRVEYSNHVFHQYTMKIKDGKRDDLKKYLDSKGVPSMIYYPIPLYKQKAFASYSSDGFYLPVTEQLCNEVLSLPIHTEMKSEDLNTIIEAVKSYF